MNDFVNWMDLGYYYFFVGYIEEIMYKVFGIQQKFMNYNYDKSFGSYYLWRNIRLCLIVLNLNIRYLSLWEVYQYL